MAKKVTYIYYYVVNISKISFCQAFSLNFHKNFTIESMKHLETT